MSRIILNQMPGPESRFWAKWYLIVLRLQWFLLGVSASALAVLIYTVRHGF